MDKKNVHWTQWNAENLCYSVLDNLTEYLVNDAAVPAKIKRSVDNPPNVAVQAASSTTMEEVAEWIQSKGMTMTIVPIPITSDCQGPIPVEVMLECWKRAGCPRDMYDIGMGCD